MTHDEFVGVTELPCWHICPPDHVRLANRGVPTWMESDSVFFFLLLRSIDVWRWAFFYVVLAGLSRCYAEWSYPKRPPRISIAVAASANFSAEVTGNVDASGKRCAALDDTDALSHRRHHEAISRYFHSWVHAVLAVYFSVHAIMDTHRIADGLHPDNGDEHVVTQWMAMTHSFGYFIADMVMDGDPYYLSHHLGPLIYAEVILRIGGSFYHAVWFGLVCEAGNVICHTCALYTKTMGFYYPYIFAITHAFSRFGSVVLAILLIACDIPVGYSWAGWVALGCACMIWGSNVADFCRVRASATVGVMATIGGKNSGAVAVSSFSLDARRIFGFFWAACRNHDSYNKSVSAGAMAGIVQKPGSPQRQGVKVNYGPRIVPYPS